MKPREEYPDFGFDLGEAFQEEKPAAPRARRGWLSLVALYAAVLMAIVALSIMLLG